MTVDGSRQTVTHGPPSNVPDVRRFHVTVLDGPQRGKSWRSDGDQCSIGSHPSNQLVLDDPTVSRFHCEIVVDQGAARLRDLGSRNTTIVDGLVAFEVLLRSGSLLQLGATVLRFEMEGEEVRLPQSDRGDFGRLIGGSPAMRGVYAILEHAAPTESTVLLEGETGTGKELTAESIHQESARRDRPFVVVDCASIPSDLLESELFGHEKGAFTGAVSRRIGAFEEASGGTIFLDEIGELPADLQPKLLRVLEHRQVRRVGTNSYLPVDVRVIAATNRDLRAMVNEGRFRSDLYYRLAVVRVRLPPLRSHPEDIPLLAERILSSLGGDGAALRTPEFLETLKASAWPGNVRELRNYLERCLVFRQPIPTGSEPAAPAEGVDLAVPFAEGRRHAQERFERAYLTLLMRAHGGRMLEAAAAAGVDRVYLYKLLRRHGLHRKR